MSAVAEQDVKVPLEFLTNGASYRLELHRDGADKRRIVTDTEVVNSGTVLAIHVLTHGGVLWGDGEGVTALDLEGCMP